MTFEEAFERLIGHEGGLSLDRSDRGNWTGGKVGVGELRGTKYGISAMAYPREDIAALTLDRARELYKRDYWDKAWCAVLPAELAFDVFDAAVNSGVAKAALWLQEAAQVPQDGIIGPVTLRAARADPDRVLRRFVGLRLLRMTYMPTWPQHGRGWARRIASNLMTD